MKHGKIRKVEQEDKQLQVQEQEEIIFTEKAIEQDLKIFQTFAQKLKQTYGRISVIRLLVFCVIVLGVLVALVAQAWWGWLLAVAGVCAFVGLMLHHAEIGNHQNYMKQLISVYERYQMRLLDKWHEFPENGEEFLIAQDYVSADLDVLGINSLYQLICTAHTRRGKQRLAEVLCMNGEKRESVKTLVERQQAVAELAKKSRYALNLEALAMQCEEGEVNNKHEGKKKEMQDASSQKSEEKAAFSTALEILAWIYPIVFAGSIIGMILHWWNSGVVLVLFLLALAFSFIMNGYCQSRMSRIFGQSHNMQTYLYMMDALATETFEASLLKELQLCIRGDEGNAANLLQGLRKLEHLIAAYNIRYNPIAYGLLNGICLYDLHLTAYAIRWERQYGTGLEKGIEAIGEVEMLSSLAVLERIRKVSYPNFIETETPEFTMQQIYHPLLPDTKAVANDIALQQKTVVITGSNMSGKTTFLRTVGLNLVLAYAGAPVCGDAAVASYMKIFTSMRVTDDVQHGISTFYAEILRIKEMVEYGKQKKPMLCLIDEIFKGTNSADRIVGAEAVIEHLSNPHTIAMVSTHDFELCRLAENYHFEEYYENDEIRFDYHLRSGMCTTTNALYLLRMAGLAKKEKDMGNLHKND